MNRYALVASIALHLVVIVIPMGTPVSALDSRTEIIFEFKEEPLLQPEIVEGPTPESVKMPEPEPASEPEFDPEPVIVQKMRSAPKAQEVFEVPNEIVRPAPSTFQAVVSVQQAVITHPPPVKAKTRKASNPVGSSKLSNIEFQKVVSKSKQVPASKTVMRRNESEKIEMDKYTDHVKRKIEAAKKYPSMMRKMRIEGTSYISFMIREDGTVSNLRNTQKSEIPGMDKSALGGVLRAAPFNTPPGGRPKAFSIAIVFRLN
ncbi:MAG: energy transducer TonB [Candidatus Lindowbacteria bacterium]|nr:energy transducer TonB [Candidatus Lindowbacteria bacterium]